MIERYRVSRRLRQWEVIPVIGNLFPCLARSEIGVDMFPIIGADPAGRPPRTLRNRTNLLAGKAWEQAHYGAAHPGNATR